MTHTGRIATDTGLFTRYIVVLPMAALLTLNVGLALFQVYVQVQLMDTEYTDQQPTQLVQRRLRGAVRERALADVDVFQLKYLMPYLQTAFLQIAMTFLQTALVFALAQGPRLSA